MRKQKILRRLARAALIALISVSSNSALALGWVGQTANGAACTGRVQAFGPYDFFDVKDPEAPQYQDARWWEVEQIHAAPGLAALDSYPFDYSTYRIASQEFDYILRAFPNQPDILHAVIELEAKRRKAKPAIEPWQTPPECYIQRGLSYRPTQAHLHQLMALYYQVLGDPKLAIPHYIDALRYSPDSPELMYNLGLAYFNVDDFDNALDYAHKAYAKGFPLPGLKSKLQRVNKWKPAFTD